MKITELATAMTGMPMGDDPVKAIDDAIAAKTQQIQAMQKEIADLRASKPKAAAAAQQQKAAATQQQQPAAKPAPTNTMTPNTTIQPAPVRPQ